MIPVKRLNHAVLYVSDLDRAVAFTRASLGWTSSPVKDAWRFFEPKAPTITTT